MMQGVIKKGDTQELERLDAFRASQKFARTIAGMIKAIHGSEMGNALVIVRAHTLPRSSASPRRPSLTTSRRSRNLRSAHLLPPGL